jgi:hypothetical protein
VTDRRERAARITTPTPYPLNKKELPITSSTRASVVEVLGEAKPVRIGLVNERKPDPTDIYQSTSAPKGSSPDTAGTLYRVPVMRRLPLLPRNYRTAA